MEREFVELMKKKMAEQKDKPADPKKMEAKATVVKDLMSSLKDLMANDIKGMKKVTVASDSAEGLEEGLEKAQDIVEKKDMSPADSINPEEEEEMDSHEMDEESKIADLEKQLAELKAKKQSPTIF